MQSFINQITIDCLVNKKLLEKKQSIENTQDILTYKNRIIQLFNDMIENENNSDTNMPDIKYAFNSFIKVSIEHFKMVDGYANDADDENENADDVDDDYADDEYDADSTEDAEDNDEPPNKILRMDNFTLDKYMKPKSQY